VYAATADGASNMQLGLLEALPPDQAWIVWCHAHLLHLVVHDSMAHVDKVFFSPIVLSHLFIFVQVLAKFHSKVVEVRRSPLETAELHKFQQDLGMEKRKLHLNVATR